MKYKGYRTVRLIISLLTLLYATNSIADVVIASGPSFYTTIFKNLPKDFERELGFKVSVLGDPLNSTSITTMEAVLTGKADGGVASAFTFDDWVQTVKKSKPELTGFESLTSRVIGHDNIKIATHRDVGVKSLTREQIRGILAGDIKNWKEIAGKDLQIKIVVVKKQGGSLRNLMKSVFKLDRIGGEEIPVDSVLAGVKKLEEMPGSVGIMTSEVLKGNLGFPSHPEFGRATILVTKGRPSPEMQKLINFITQKHNERETGSANF